MTDSPTGALSERDAIETKQVWVAWTNTDLTEGRGHQLPLAVSFSETTAIRLGKKGYVQGCDCPVTEETAVRINRGRWLVPGVIHEESASDKQDRERLEAKRAAIQRATEAGLSAADLKAMGVQS